jgi:DNA modification methylase
LTVSAGASTDHERSNASSWDPHPARFPSALPEYFIKLLTDPGDLVVDPFAGSCITGEVSESLRREWVCCELQADYLEPVMNFVQAILYSVGYRHSWGQPKFT